MRDLAFSVYERVGDHWEVTEKDGVRWRFGVTADSRVSDPDDPGRVQTWLPSQQVDMNGNAVDYSYTRIDGHPYLTGIGYATFRVGFEYEVRPDVVTNGRAGFAQRVSRRCRAITLTITPGRLVRTLAFTYVQAPLSGLSQLASARLTAHGDDVPDVVRNPVTFEYGSFDPAAFRVRFMEADGGASPPPLNDPDVALVALDDLPLPGVLTNHNGRLSYWENSGEGRWRGPRPVPRAPFVRSFGSDGVALIDMDGGGTADMLVAVGGNPLNGYYQNAGAVGFGDFVGYPRTARTLPPVETGRVRLGDLDGDGVVDALLSTDRGLVTYRNRVAAGWAEPTVAPDPAGVSFADRLTHLADMNGDGLPDVVRVRSGRIEYLPNLGHGRFGAPVAMTGSPRLEGLSGAPEQVLLLDVDGDGLADLVRVSAAGVDVYPNRSGHGFGPRISHGVVPAPIPGTVRAADMDGSGRAGLVYNTRRATGLATVWISWPQLTPPHVLRRMDNGSGLVSTFEYASVVEMALADRAEGRRWDTSMPFPMQVVAATIEVDTVRGRTLTTRYRYRDAHYDPVFRRFQGFREVDKREVGDESRADVLVRHRFLMNQAGVPGNTRDHAHLDRMLERVEAYSLDGTPQQDRPVRWEETVYGIRELEVLADGTTRVFTFPHITRKHYPERTNDDRIEERELAYDAVGNVVREVCRGRGTQGGVARPELETITEIEYARDPASRIHQMCRTVKRDPAGVVLMEMRRLFDGRPLGELTRGLLTREEHLVLPLAGFQAHYAGMDAAALGYLEQPDVDGTPSVFALETERKYTAQGNVDTKTSGLGRTTVTTYDADHLHTVQEVVNGKVTTRTNDPVTGKPTRLTSAGGASTRMTYDAFGRLTAYMVADDTPAAASRVVEYDNTAVPNSITVDHRVDATTRARTVTYYDGSAREVQKRVQRQADEVVVSPWVAHNPWGDTKEEFEPTLDTTLAFAVPPTSARPSRTVQLDAEGRPVRANNYNGARSTVEITPFEVTIRDAADLTPGAPGFDTPRREQVNVWNQRTAILEAGSETRFWVGQFGELRELGDAVGTVCTYHYDLRGNRLRIDHRDAGHRIQWFNSHNEIVRTVDAKGDDVEVERDPEGRVTRVLLNGALTETFVYGDDDPAADGRLVDARYPGGRQEYTYDARGFLTEHRLSVGGQVLTLGYDHDDTGRQTSVTYPDGTVVTRSHMLNGVVARIDGVVDRIDYDARNLPTRIEFANGVTTTVGYEPGVGHIASQHTVGPGGVVLEDAVYTYDEMMRLSGTTDVADSATYGYDPLGQLAHVEGTDAGGPYAFDYTHHNSYDLVQVGESGSTLGYSDPARPDRVTTVDRPGEPRFDTVYDATGNLSALPGRTMEFNYKNQLTRVTVAGGPDIRYDYDYRGNLTRRRSTQGPVTDETLFLGRLMELRSGQHVNFVVHDRRRIAVKRGAQTRWVHLDPVGSARLFTDETGASVAQIAYHPFGKERIRVGSPATRTFALHDFDEATGLVYMGFRWYAPEMGRFLTPDPLYLHDPDRSDGDPVKLRLYTYTGNDPLGSNDPQGLSFWSVVGAIVGVIVGIIAAVAIIAAFACGIGFGLLAVAGLIGLVTVSYVVAANNQGTALGEFFRGFMLGLNAGLNATFLAAMGPVGAFLGGFVGTIIFLGAFDEVAALDGYQGVLGWSNWLMPMSWLVIGLGAAMWILNGLGHLIFWSIPQLWGGGIQFFRIEGFRMDWSTGMLATRGGWVANLNNIDTAYNMGFFAYVDSNSSGWHIDHEAGHNLNLGVFGSIFHFVGFIHEMGTAAGSGAFSEVQADSNAGRPGMWS
ncbi:toxin TcdB middle/N-terminal domain-containing protein [Actinomycetospora lutea]|uniref:toxin TcdB middle/N-terminal domain-containing protein n=1 Tax=Actinomycetospora lutea TaxID=663604 RepID=UPI002366F83C|nr:toxin TcdB middle/N-terminal domain-containing protein [Actinomycetospora lutea]MDD7942025.1 toxin TcdB middle/N-terminal domain-containing protein [Actinomycetospora lutea]